MINEARKRDHLANAVLALSFAANAAQSPKDLVRSGNIEGPGLQVMSRMMKKRAEAERNLDSPRVSEPARNRKKKTFEEFVTEVRKYTKTRSKEEAETIRKSKKDPSLYRLKNRQTVETPLWGLELKSKQKEQQQRRSASLRPINYQEILSAVKRDLSIPNSEVRSVAKKAHSTERSRKATQTRTRNRLTQETGKEHNVDHIVPQPNRRPEALRSRFQAIHPGDASDNREVSGARENREKNSKNTKSKLTRSGAVRRALDRAKRR
jgi:hypothetical protein